MSKTEIAVILTGLAQYYGKKLEEFESEAYLTALSNYPSELVKKAAFEVMNKMKFMPKISELREILNSYLYVTRLNVSRIEESPVTAEQLRFSGHMARLHYMWIESGFARTCTDKHWGQNFVDYMRQEGAPQDVIEKYIGCCHKDGEVVI